jgi:hypothetical protein
MLPAPEMLQVPPVGVLLNVVTELTHTAAVPAITEGTGCTVTVAVTQHPVPYAYVIIAVPAKTPVAIPVAEPIVATDVLLLLHVPPAVLLLKEVARPVQTVVVPVIAVRLLTVTTSVVRQPVLSV